MEKRDIVADQRKEWMAPDFVAYDLSALTQGSLISVGADGGFYS